MSKHKKTRKEKIIADYRHQVYILKNNIPLGNSTATTIAINESSDFTANILKDVLKTTILTCAIVVAQIILFFLLRRHIINLPIVKY
jgi:ABC-type Fe3+-citrate transport system substrate-binding protein